jgi:AcrR family transcriptional regulator
MPRVVKTAAERKDELVDCAQALFFAKGYEATTIADILARARLSKGAFYHHFASKEDLLDALTERVSRAVIAAAQDVLDDESLDALTRLNRFLARSGQWKREAAPMLGQVYAAMFKPENAQLYHRMVHVAVTSITPVLTHIVEQGVREGTFDVPDAGVVAEILVQLANARQALVAEAVQQAARGEIDQATETLEHRIGVEEKIIDRILGLPEGSITLFAPGFLREMMAVMAKAERTTVAKNAA